MWQVSQVVARAALAACSSAVRCMRSCRPAKSNEWQSAQRRVPGVAAATGSSAWAAVLSWQSLQPMPSSYPPPSGAPALGA